MSGLKGLLDDAYAQADALRATLDEAANTEDRGYAAARDLADAADDLANRIDQQRNALRS